MPIQILMPALSPTMKAGNLVKWHKKKGDPVETGDLLAEIETDKATMEVEAVDEGTIGAIVVAEGTKDVLVNTVIATLLEEGETEDALSDLTQNTETSTEISEAKTTSEKSPDTAPTASSPKVQSASGLRPSPLARRLADAHGLDLTKAEGSGPSGRVVRQDIEHLLEGQEATIVATPPPPPLQKAPVTPSATASTRQPAPVDEAFSGFEPEFALKPRSGMREVIAQRLWQSKNEMPHFYLSVDVVMEEIANLRQKLKAKDIKLSVNDFVLKATAQALKEHPGINAAWAKNGIRYYTTVDLAVAVSIPDGLITPVIRNAEKKDMRTLSTEMKALAGKAKESKLAPQEFQGGTFTVSSLGMFGIRSFAAIVNPPQAGILAVGAMRDVPVVQGGEIKAQKQLNMTVSVDHRVVDGVLAAQFINTVKSFLEEPILMVV